MISCGSDDPVEDFDCNTVDATYDGDVKAIIDGCAIPSCHGGIDTSIPEVNRNYTTYAGLNSATSSGLLVQRVINQENMPPAGALPQSQLDLLQCWADAGYPEN